MSQPLFSIVIPTYNRAELVQGAVRSVLAQSFDDLEVVVSDNGSQDNTREAVLSFTDPRVRYVRTPSHTSIADSWEFARSQARGKFVMMLSDDDAVLPDGMAHFAEAHRRHEADFLFCDLAEYFDSTFVGPQRNTVGCPRFSGATRVVSVDELLTPLFAFRPAFNMHPSAFVFSSAVAEQVVRRCGRFFTTNGVEYFAWPLAAVFSKRIVHIDLPLVILGRTFKSWGSTIVLSNPGKEQIAKMIADVNHDRDWVPLTNFTLTNLMAEGLYLGKKLFPDELAAFPLDEHEYLRKTFGELRRREQLGVDVHRELEELFAYARKYPAVEGELTTLRKQPLAGEDSALVAFARNMWLNRVRRRVMTLLENRRIERGGVGEGFTASGDDFGFTNAVECAGFVARVTSASAADRGSSSQAAHPPVLSASSGQMSAR
jgi:glycosyltransferase involved in cell wall biosynthesis